MAVQSLVKALRLPCLVMLASAFTAKPTPTAQTCRFVPPLFVGTSLGRASTSTGHTEYDTTGTLPSHATFPTTMVPLSCPPLLLLKSSSPLISKDGCDLLSRYFEQRTTNEQESQKAEMLLQEVHSVINTVTNCPHHQGEMTKPRYVKYIPKLVDKGLFLDALLPDGLHVDTNNGKLFRHITAILYLTTNKDGFIDDYRSDGNLTLVAGRVYTLWKNM
jgi:hypothetical protein